MDYPFYNEEENERPRKRKRKPPRWKEKPEPVKKEKKDEQNRGVVVMDMSPNEEESKEEFLNNVKEEMFPAIFILMGPSGCGKTTLSNKIMEAFSEEDIRHVSSDDMRGVLTGDKTNQEVTGAAHSICNKICQIRCEYGQSTIKDATNLTPSFRKSFLESVEDHPVSIIGIVFDVDKQTCIDRQQERDRKVPRYAIEKQYSRYEQLENDIHDEPFDEIFHYEG